MIETSSGVVDSGREGSVAVADEDGQDVVASVGRDDIGVTVAVDVADRDEVGRSNRREARGRTESSIAVAQEHGNDVIVRSSTNNIEMAITVHIGQGANRRTTRNGVENWSDEASSRVHQHRD